MKTYCIILIFVVSSCAHFKDHNDSFQAISKNLSRCDFKGAKSIVSTIADDALTYNARPEYLCQVGRMRCKDEKYIGIPKGDILNSIEEAEIIYSKMLKECDDFPEEIVASPKGTIDDKISCYLKVIETVVKTRYEPKVLNVMITRKTAGQCVGDCGGITHFPLKFPPCDYSEICLNDEIKRLKEKRTLQTNKTTNQE